MPRPSTLLATSLALAGLAWSGIAAPPARALAPTVTAAATAPIRSQVVGRSVQGRNILAYQVGDPTSTRVVVVIGQMHGNETAGVSTARAIIRRAGVSRVKGVQLWVIPTMNPDGLAHGTRRNAHNVDLNRNWGYDFVRSRARWTGPYGFSEPENRAMRSFFRAHHPSRVVVLHQPFGTIDLYGKDVQLRRALMANLHLPASTLDCGSGCHGTLTQWVNHTTSGAAVTVEYVRHPSWRFVNVTARDGIVRALGGRF